MTYVMADIHGMFEKYEAMLEKIEFSDEDKLYIIGDVVDRGPHGIEILEDVMKRKNVVLMMGNHESLCVNAMKPGADYNQTEFWKRIGGLPTYHAMSRILETDGPRAEKLLNFMAKLPYTRTITVKGRKFYLVHAFPADTKREKIWTRAYRGADTGVPNATVIVGHTQAIQFATNREIHEMIKKGHQTICNTGSFIAIDCGCGYVHFMSRLACLRLDDMAEFYV